ncbi:MAG: type II secretion system protein [Gammaproteobacteria bacterium]
MNKQHGFTLIELVMVIVILGILAAIAVPKFVDLSTDATTAAEAGMSGAVSSAQAIAIAKLHTFPTLSQLVGSGTAANPGYIQAQGVKVNGNNKGVDVLINGSYCTVQTYTDSNCSTGTGNATDQVQCVGTTVCPAL